MIPQAIIELLQEQDIQLNECIAIPASGGDRQYYRLATNIGNLIGAHSSNIAETRTFLEFTKSFSALQLPVPKIIAVNKSLDWYIQTDAGKDCLLDIVLQDGITPNTIELYKQVIIALPKFQILAHKTIDYNLCLAAKQFNTDAALFDLNYFVQYYLDVKNYTYDAQKLQEEFKQLSQQIGNIEPKYFMYRDLQGRNIMVNKGQVSFIDYQGGMLGPLQYDVVSLLWQAKAQLPLQLRSTLLELYFSEANALLENTLDKNLFIANYYSLVLMRLLQVLGAYGRRGLLEGKQHFITSIPAGLQNIKQWLQLQDISNTYPELFKTLQNITHEQ